MCSSYSKLGDTKRWLQNEIPQLFFKIEKSPNDRVIVREFGYLCVNYTYVSYAHIIYTSQKF